MALLDRFSPEEIAQLKKELNDLGKNHGKDSATREAQNELRALFVPKRPAGKPYEQDNSDIANLREVYHALYALVDNTLHNFAYVMRKSEKGKYRWVTPKKMGTIHHRVNVDEYAEMYSELVAVIKKHFRPVSVKEAKAIGESEGTIKWDE